MRKDRFLRLLKDLAQVPSFCRQGYEPPTSYCLSELQPITCSEFRQLYGGGTSKGRVPKGTAFCEVDEHDTDDELDSQQFVPEEWIGCGRQWNHSTPGHVKKARNEARLVPPDVATFMVPPPSTSISDLLARTDPNMPFTRSKAPVYSPAAPLFASLNIHDEGEMATFQRTLFGWIPHHAKLRDTFNDAWLSGAQSVSILDINSYNLPLWSERLVGDLRSYVTLYNLWARSSKWLSDLGRQSKDSQKLIDECRTTMDHIPYAGMVPGFSKAVNLSLSDLSLFLTDEWLNDEMINAGAEYILHQLGPRNRRRIANCLLVSSLERARARSAVYRRRPSTLNRLLENNAIDKLYVPLHVSNNHWTLLEVDIQERTFAYADSLTSHATPPQSTLNVLEWWINQVSPSSSRQPKSFRLIEASFAMAHQQDSFSCGIVVLSTLATILLNYNPWTPETYSAERMEWFLRLSEYLADTEDSGDAANDIGYSHTAPKLSNTILPEAEPDLESNDMDLDYVDIIDDDNLPDSCPVPSNNASDPASLMAPGHTSLSTLPASLTSDSGKDEDSDSDSLEGRRNKRRKVGLSSGAKVGTSWAFQKATKSRQINDPTFKLSDTKLLAFRNKVRVDDPFAEFKKGNPCAVRCSSCRAWLEMRVLYDLLHWKNHRKTKKCQQAQAQGGHTKSLFHHGFLSKVGPSSTVLSSPITMPCPARGGPCPGLTRESDSRIDRYLFRSSATGGGAPSRSSIACQLFDDDSLLWSDLSDRQQRLVKRREQFLHKWINSRAVGAVFSTRCEQTVYCLREGEYLPCDNCVALHRLHTFQVQLTRTMPDDKNMRYVPKGHRNTELGEIYLKYKGVKELLELDDGRSPWLKFAQGVADGMYKTQETLLGMVSGMVKRTERLEKGKSLRNMKYSSGFNDFCNILGSVSTRAYRTFQRHFGGPAVRSMRQMRARLPRFRPDINVANVEMARLALEKYGYSGPVALSWDDTELEPAISVYQDGKDSVLVIGGVDGPIKVQSLTEYDVMVEKTKIIEADKLRVWLITVPLPKIPSIMVAAVARGSKVPAEGLFEMHRKLTGLLAGAGIHPVSLSADGSETERATERLIEQSADEHRHYVIPSAHPGCSVHLVVPLFNGRPSVLCQDSKHGKKTARNQLQTGARIIVLANMVIFFSMLYDMAKNVLSPLFKHDVDKVDKQDDRAASRLFSAEMLHFQLKNYSDHHGVTVYLFIMGELIDAWQSRNICHLERAKMVLRARFFLMAWRSHIAHHPDYSVNTQFISRESYEIFMYLCDSLLSLILVYRGFYPTYPLLPWLHSTEPCEHLFGMLRQLKRDFNFADMLYLEPKLRALMLGEFGNLTAEQKANQTSSGYHHTYFKADDLDMTALFQYPTDRELETASSAAFIEASQLLASVGIDAAEMLRTYTPPKSQPPKKKAYIQTQPREPQTLLATLALYDGTTFATTPDEDEFEACEMAAAAEAVDKSLKIEALPDSTDESFTEVASGVTSSLSVYYHQNKNTKPFHLETLPLADRREFNANVLVAERFRHQTKETSKAIRQLGHDWIATPKKPTLQDSLRQRIRLLGSKSTTMSSTAGVGRQVGDVVIVLQPAKTKQEVPKLHVAKVIAMYTKATYRGAKHEAVSKIESVGLPSNIYEWPNVHYAVNFKDSTHQFVRRGNFLDNGIEVTFKFASPAAVNLSAVSLKWSTRWPIFLSSGLMASKNRVRYHAMLYPEEHHDA
ncbi:hypothetical protein GALMADRAFT_283972, partial [Galerina marginata CBS 339.88]